MTSRLFGAHVSAAGGVDMAVVRAAALEATCVQVFSGSPRVWQRPDLASIDTKKIAAKQAEYGVEAIFTHALYLLNLASDKPDLVEKSTQALLFDLQFDARVAGSGVVVHVGSHQGRGWEAVKDQVATTIAAILAKTPTESHFLIENAAGQQGKVGGDLAEIAWIIKQINSPRVGWCLDTCHAFASGYALVEVGAVSGQKQTRAQTLLAEMADHDLEKHLKCIHVNDSRDPFGSGRDRHDNLGDGQIPSAALSAFLRARPVAHLPLILEVPGMDGNGPDLINMQRLKKLVE